MGQKLKLKEKRCINDRTHPISRSISKRSCPDGHDLRNWSAHSVSIETPKKVGAVPHSNFIHSVSQIDGTTSTRDCLPIMEPRPQAVHPASQHHTQAMGTAPIPTPSFVAFAPNRLPPQVPPQHQFAWNTAPRALSAYGIAETRPTNQPPLESVHSLQLADQRMASLPYKTPQLDAFPLSSGEKEEEEETKDADESTFEKLVRVTEGCTTKGDPFAPTPLGPDVQFRKPDGKS